MLLVDHEPLADLLAHGLPEHVGLGHRVAGHAHRDLHDLLLIDHDPVGPFEDVAQILVRERHVVPPVFAARVLRVHPGVQWPRPVQSHERHHVLEPVGLEVLDELAHAGRLHLEHAGGVAALQHRVHGLVVERHVVDVELHVSAPQVRERVLDHREVAQAEEVHLQEAEFLHARAYRTASRSGGSRRVSPSRA
jgi:hypothetical protein